MPESVAAVGLFLDRIHLKQLKPVFMQHSVSGFKLRLMFGPEHRSTFDTMEVSPLDVAVLEHALKEKGWLY